MWGYTGLTSLLVDAGSGGRERSPLRVLLADGHALMRRSLRLLLDGEDGIDVVAEADRLRLAERLVSLYRPDVLVVAFGMPNGSSVETIGRLRRLVPSTQIVVLTMDESGALARLALDSGALGFVMIDHADSELPQALRAVARGEQYVSAAAAGRLDALRRSLERD